MQSPTEKTIFIPRLKAGPLEPWTIREKLCLASAVRHNGDQNWISVSRSMKPFLEPHRPPERFSQKNCALQYAELLENVDPPKRVKRGDKDAKETSEDIIVRKLTYQRIEELKRIVGQEKDKFIELKRQQEMLRKGMLDEKLPEMWTEVQAKRRAAEEAEAALKAANEEAARAAKEALKMRASTPGSSMESPSVASIGSPSNTPNLFSPASSTIVGISASASAPIETCASSDLPTSPIKTVKSSTSSLVTKLLLSPNQLPPIEEKSKTEPIPMEPEVINVIKDEKDKSIPSEEKVVPKLLEYDVSTPIPEEKVEKISSIADESQDKTKSVSKPLEKTESDLKKEEVITERIDAILPDECESTDMEVVDKTAPCGNEVTLEDIQKHKNGQILAKKDDDNIALAETDSKISNKDPESKKTNLKSPSTEHVGNVDDSESEADAEVYEQSDFPKEPLKPRGRRCSEITSGATPSESETEDTMSNAASPRAEGIGGKGKLRHVGSDIGSSTAGPPSSCPNSPASISQSSDIEADEKAHRAWKKSIMLVWRNASHHKYANLFLAPVTDEIAPGYSVVVKRPLDLKTVKSKIDNGQISTTLEFQRDIMLMFTNAIMYNNSDQEIYTMTNEMYRDVMVDIEQFVSTQMMVQAAAALASSGASDSVASPAVASSGSRGLRRSRAQKLQEITGDDTDNDILSGTLTPQPSTPVAISSFKKRGNNDDSNKAKKRRSTKELD